MSIYWKILYQYEKHIQKNAAQHLRLFLSLQEHQKGVRLGRSVAEAQRPGGSAELKGCIFDYGSGREA